MNDPADQTAPNLRNEDVDRLGKALLTLARELWVVKDRQKILEAVLEDALKDKGIAVAELLEQHEPDAKLAAQLSTDRAAFIASLLASLEGK